MSTIWDEIDRTIGRPSAAPRRTSVWDDIDRELARDEAADAELAQAGAPRPTLPNGPTLAELVGRRSAPPPPRETWDAPPPQMDLGGIATSAPTTEGARAAREMAAEAFGVANRAVTNVPRAIAAGVPSLNQSFWGGVQALGESTGLEPVADFGRRAGAQAKQLATDIAGPQEGAGWAERAAYGGLQSVVPSVAALAAGAVTGNPTVALGAMGAMTGGTSYAEAREAGVPVPQALVYGASQGAVEAATERLPVGQLLGDLAQRTGLFRTVLHQIATEVPTEQAATVLQDLNEWATLTPERPIGDYLRERPSAAAETLVATIAATALQTGAMHLGTRLAERGSGPPPGRPTPPPSVPDGVQAQLQQRDSIAERQAAQEAAERRVREQAAFARYAAADAAAQPAPDTAPSAPPVDTAAVQRAARGTRLPGASLAEQLGELVVPEVRYADDPLTLAEREQVAAAGGDPLLAYGEVAAEMGWPEPVAGRRMDAPETPQAAPPLRREPPAAVEPVQREAAQAPPPAVPRDTPRIVAEIDATLAEETGAAPAQRGMATGAVETDAQVTTTETEPAPADATLAEGAGAAPRVSAQAVPRQGNQPPVIPSDARRVGDALWVADIRGEDGTGFVVYEGDTPGQAARGYVVAEANPEIARRAVVVEAETFPPRQGIGTRLYTAAAAEAGRRGLEGLGASAEQSQAAERFWGKLRRTYRAVGDMIPAPPSAPTQAATEAASPAPPRAEAADRAPSAPAVPPPAPATTPPGPPAAASRFVARPADAPGWYRVVDTQTGETVVTTKGRQAAVGEARRRNGRPAKATKGPKVDPFDAIEAAARERGYYGPREGLARAYRDFQSANEAMSEAAGDAAGEGVALLRAIAQAGGLGPDAAFQGELDDLWEASTGTYVPTLTRTRTGRVPKARRFPKGGLLGVSGVLVRSGGLPVDRVREAVADLPQFRHFADAKGAEFLDAVREAVARGRQELPTPTGQWWQPFVGDDGVAPEQREPDFLNEHELTAEGIAEVFGYSKAQAADLLKIAQAYFTDEQLEQLTLFKGGTPGERGESYRQSAARIRERWRRTDLVTVNDAAMMLGDAPPAYLEAVVAFMAAQRQKVLEGRLTVRDVAKAYLLTLGSIGADAINVSTLRKTTGFAPDPIFVTSDGKIRPEEAVAAWLMTDDGRALLDRIEAGTVTRPDFEELLRIRDAFGRNDIRNNGLNAEARGRNLWSLQAGTDELNGAKGDLEAMQRTVQSLTGISDGKARFIKHLLGFGDTATVDAVELNFWLTGRGTTRGITTRRAALVNALKTIGMGDPVTRRAVTARIQARLARLSARYGLPPEIGPHIMHHWLWDKAKGTETTHAGMMAAMALAQEPPQTSDYRGSHRPSGADSGAPLHDLTGDGRIYPSDVYGADGERIYAAGTPQQNREAFAIARRLKGKPDAEVTVYRAVPKGVAQTALRPGDWVAITRGYAEDHGARWDEGATIIAQKVRAREIFTSGDSIQEWGYWPQSQSSNILFQSPTDGATADTWYFHPLSRAVAAWQPRGTAEQLRAHLAKTKGATDEARDMGLLDWLAGREKVTRAEVEAYLQQHTVVLEETVLADEGETARAARDRIQAAGYDIAVTDMDTDDGQEVYLTRLDEEGFAEEVDLADAPTEVQAAFRQYQAKASPPQYQRYTIPGGENYREILLRMPTRTTEITDPPRRTPVEVRGPTPGSGQFFLVDAQGEWVGTDERPTYYATRADAEAALDWLRVTPATRTVVDAANNYTAPHFSAYPNILTHIRVNERTLVDGRRVLFIEEIQSDWHQTGRRQGYASEVAELERQHAAKIEEIYARENELPRGTRDDAEVFRLTDEANEIFDRLQSLKEQVVPDAPFKGDLWKKLALKRMLAYAAEQGMDGIAWTTGAQQVDRYENELRQNVDEIRWTRQGYHAYLVVTAFKGNRVRFEGTASRNDAGAWVFNSGPAAGKTVEDVLGKEITKQIAERQEGSARGDSLTVGGEGMKGFYDRELVNLANDLAKPWKQRVEPAYMTGPNTQGIANDNAQHAAAIGAAPVHFLATPAPMRDDIRQRRLALYQTLNRASVEFFDNMSRALIRALSRPDASSFLHELGHVIHAWLLNRDIPADLREGVTDEMIDKIERFLGVEAGTPWIAIPRPAKERFAQAFVTFVNEGKAPTPALRPVFSRIAAWLKKLWAALGTTETIEITDEVREVFTQLAQNVERLRLARTGPPPGRPQATVAPDAPRGPPTTRRGDDVALPGLAALRGQTLGATEPRLATVAAMAPDDGTFALTAENEPPPDSRAAREAAGQATMFERGGVDRERPARETPAEPAPGHVPATPRTTLTTREAFDRWLPDATPPPTPQSEGQTIGLLRTIFGEAIPPSPWDRLRGRASGGVVPIPVGYRRFRERALGLYKRHEHAIRLKSWGDLNTFVHELGHALDSRLLGYGKPESFMNGEILALGRETSAANAEQDILRAEGVANFFRAYFRDPAWARTLAPTYAAELEAYLATQPVVAQQLEDGVGVVRAYLAQDEATRGAARIDFTGNTQASPRTFWQRTWDAWFDEHTPLKRIEQKLTSDPLNITQSPYWLRRLASGMDAKASAFLEGQVRGVDGRILGPGLKTVLAPIDAKDRQTFSRYLVARHALHHYVQGVRAAGQVDQAIRLEREYGLPSTILPEGYAWTFKDPGLSFKEAAALLKRTRTDTFDEVAEGLAGFRRAVMAYLVERGAVSHATRDLLEELYGAYVPLYRVMDRDDDGVGAGGRTEIASLGSPIKTRKGSRRDIIDPLETTIRNTVAMVRMAERNAVWQALVTLAEKTPTGAKILERIPDPVQAQQVNLLALKRSIAQALSDQFDFDLATETKDLIAQRVEAVKEEFEDDEALRSDEGRKALKDARKDPLDVLALYFAPVPLSARGHDVERVIIDGQPIFHEIHDRELLEYLAGLDAQSASRLVGLADAVLAPFTRLKRAGITLAPDFGARNIARDAVMAFLNSDYGFKPGVDTLRGLRDFMAKGENYWLWRAGGGEMAVFAGQDREEVRQYLREVFDLEHVKTPHQFLAAYARAFKDAKTHWEQAKTLGKLADASLLQPLRVLSGAMEAATRLGEFRRALESEGYHDAAVRKTKGISKSEAYARAIRASREVSLDFQSGGSKARQWNRSQAFFNATLLGVRRLGEVGTRHPARSLRRLAVMSVMPAVATVVLRALLDRDDEWEELDPGVRKSYWHIPAPPPLTWIRYPKAFDVDDLIGSRVEAILHAAIKQDRSVLKDVMPGGLEEALRWMAQRVIPDAILPALEVAANYHFFRDREIVPSWREGLDRELQASRYTSEVAKALGPRLGLAPDEFDHLFYGYTGGLGRHVLSGASTVMAATGATAGPPAPRPARGVNGLPVVGVFVRRGGAGLQAQSIADLFKEADQWTGKTRSRAEYRRAGQAAKVAEVDAWMAEHGGETRRKAVAQAVEALREERTLINAIYRAPGTVLTADEKAVLLDLVEARMGQAARRAMGRTPLKTPPADPAVLALERKVKAWKPETGIPAKPPR